MASRITITGGAGFIGSTLALAFAQAGHSVHSIDWVDDTGRTTQDRYPEPWLQRLRMERMARLRQGGVTHHVMDIGQPGQLFEHLQTTQPAAVIHLAAQAGVRHSIQAPMDFVWPNLQGFAQLLDACHRLSIPRLLYASSSSVYGARHGAPFIETDRTDQPQSFYAATKMANEAMAMAYDSQYGLKSIGMRFFTVYGPWGRPDMAPFLFAQNLRRRQPVRLFAEGQLLRDFTFVNDTVAAVMGLCQLNPWIEHSTVVNVGHNTPIKIIDFVSQLADRLGVTAQLEMAPMQTADVPLTCADEQRLLSLLKSWPHTALPDGIDQFVRWLDSWDPLTLTPNT